MAVDAQVPLRVISADRHRDVPVHLNHRSGL